MGFSLVAGSGRVSELTGGAPIREHSSSAASAGHNVPKSERDRPNTRLAPTLLAMSRTALKFGEMLSYFIAMPPEGRVGLGLPPILYNRSENRCKRGLKTRFRRLRRLPDYLAASSTA